MTKATLPPAADAPAGHIDNLPLEVRALVVSLQRRRSAVRNRRKDVRHPFLFQVAMHFRDAKGDARTVRVHTRDRTDACIAFLTDAHLPRGEKVVLDFTGTQETHALGRVDCRVRRCRQFLEGWFECVVQVGEEARRPMSLWERFTHWLGEFSGFGPDCRRESARQARGACPGR